jgi:Holliday junction resolvase RusA-like endonuclease
MTRIAFSIPGPPKGKGRPRTAPGQSRPYTPKETVEAEKAVRDLFTRLFPDHVPFAGPIMLRFTAVFDIPESWPKYLKDVARQGKIIATCKPDKDNIEKLIADAIGKDPRSGRRIAWMDDAQLQGGGVKRYGYPARVDVVLETMQQPDVPLTPGQRRFAALSPEQRKAPPPPRKKNTPKSETKKLDPQLALAIERAIAKDK